jgi:hypothetical protein
MTVTVKHPFVSAIPDSADTSLVRPSNWNADHTIIGLGTAAEKDVGVANGVASLDSGGKVPVSELPAAVLGALSYQGTWNASTNTPTLASGVGTKGYYYVVSVAGSTNLDGITDWKIGDWAVYNGTAWQKVDNTESVVSVNGQTGVVVLAVGDISGAANAPTNTNITSMTGVTGGISSPDYIQFDTAYATTLTAGQLGWDGNNTLGIGMAGGHVIQHIGEDQFFYCKATSAITKGQVVMFTGAVGASGVPTGAPATGIADGSYIMGVAAETIALNDFGLIQTFGTLRNVNTSTYVDGEILWYNPAVTGGLTATKPSAPNVKVQMAAVINGGSSGGGTILIRINPGSQLGGTDSNVQIGTPISGNTLIYDAAVGYWKNANLSAGTGISVTNGAGSITVANTAPDQTVALTAGTGISVSGTYPSFTVTNTSPSSGGTVTAVTGTAPVVSSGGTTPAISMAAATSSVNGYLTSADWTTFNNKGSGSVTSVAASVPSFLSVAGSPITTSGTLAISYSGIALPVANGGTGVTSVGTAGNVLTSNGTAWVSSAPVSSNITAQGLFENANTISANYTIGTNNNAVSAGPITVASGVTVTVPSGSVWTIV